MGTTVNPPEQLFGEAGFIYTIDFELGEFEVYDFRGRPIPEPGEFNKGLYQTHIQIHNPYHEEQRIFIKMFLTHSFMKDRAGESVEQQSTWYRPTMEGLGIPPNGAYHLSSRDITFAFRGYVPAGVPSFKKGLVVVSHPLPSSDEGIALDVRVTYTYFVQTRIQLLSGLFTLTLGGARSGSKHVESVPGVRVPRVPMPAG